MDASENNLRDLIYSDTYKTLAPFLDTLQFLITQEIGADCLDSKLVSFDCIVVKDFLNEIKSFNQSRGTLHFGKTLQNLKCITMDRESREHEIWIDYVGPKKLHIVDMSVPRSYIQDQVFKTLDEVINVFAKYLDELSSYLEELDQISQFCTVMEPVRPTYKEAYRRIHLADRTWLHVEVSPNGSARNLGVVGHFDQQRLQELLQAWDHDTNIATNVLKIIRSLKSCDDSIDMNPEQNQVLEVPSCGICLCVELPGETRVPQPICNNSSCGVYFHRSCLYEWLVGIPGGRQPAFAIGKCPSCSHHIHCNDRDLN